MSPNYLEESELTINKSGNNSITKESKNKWSMFTKNLTSILKSFLKSSSMILNIVLLIFENFLQKENCFESVKNIISS